MELRQLLTALRRRWKFVVAVVLSGVVGAFVITLAMTPMYESANRIYFSASGAAVADQIQLGVYTAQRAKSYAAMAEDTTVLAGVIDRAEVDTTPAALAKRVELEVIRDTVVLRLAVRDADPGVARKLADAYAAEIAATVTELETPAAAQDDQEPQSPIVAQTLGEASVTSSPVTPSFPLNLGVGALLGVLFGVGGAIVRELPAGDPDATRPMRPGGPQTRAPEARAPEVRRELVP